MASLGASLGETVRREERTSLTTSESENLVGSLRITVFGSFGSNLFKAQTANSQRIMLVLSTKHK